MFFVYHLQHHYKVTRSFSTLAATLVFALAYAAQIALNIFGFVQTHGPIWKVWGQFSLAEIVSLLILVIGMMVWRYCQSRQIAVIFSGFSLSLMLLFAILPIATESATRTFWTVCSSSLTTASLFFLLFILLLVPQNYLKSPHRGVLVAVIGIAVMSLSVVVLGVVAWLFPALLPLSLVETVTYGFYGIMLCAVIALLLTAFWREPMLRKRQQLILFCGGIFVSILPILSLTILPKIFSLSTTYIVPGNISGLSIGLLPVILGYAIIRYDMLVRDKAVLAFAVTLLRVIGLTICGYGILFISTLFFSGLPGILATALLSALVALVIWQGSMWVATHVVFQELRFYQRVLEGYGSGLRSIHSDDERKTVRDMMNGITILFQPEVAHFFSFDPFTDTYRDQDAFPSLAFDAHAPFLQQIASRSTSKSSEGITPFSEHLPGDDDGTTLLVPFSSDEQLLGFIALGPRRDGNAYSGVDYEALALLQRRFVPLLLVAALSKRKKWYAYMQGKLAQAVSEIPPRDHASDTAFLYAQAACSIFDASSAKVWLSSTESSDERSRPSQHAPASELRRISAKRDTTSPYEMIFKDEFSAEHMMADTSDLFASHHTEQQQYLRERLSFALASDQPALQTLAHPVAWLPFVADKTLLGVLVCVWPAPHQFVVEEVQLLDMFRTRLLGAIQTARITQRLLQTNDELRRIGTLKEEFMTNASHELRTPLTIVEGYLELLRLPTLNEKERPLFLQKAVEACDELATLIQTILEAGSASLDDLPLS